MSATSSRSSRRIRGRRPSRSRCARRSSISGDRRGYERRSEEREHALLADQLITAEQEERRRLALFLHDGPVQSLAGIALMLDAVLHAVGDGRLEDAKRVLESALERHRQTIRSLRDLSFNLEPVVLRDQGLGAAVEALADQLRIEHRVEIALSVEGVEAMAERAQVALYQIVREALNQAVRRGPTTVTVEVRRRKDESILATIADDGAEERRRGAVEVLEERTRALGGSVKAHRRAEGGSTVRIALPAHAVRR